jgi:hypothetical protein
MRILMTMYVAIEFALFHFWFRGEIFLTSSLLAVPAPATAPSLLTIALKGLVLVLEHRVSALQFDHCHVCGSGRRGGSVGGGQGRGLIDIACRGRRQVGRSPEVGQVGLDIGDNVWLPVQEGIRKLAVKAPHTDAVGDQMVADNRLPENAHLTVLHECRLGKMSHGDSL